MRTPHVLEGPAGAPVVLLVHPLGVTLSLWERTAAALAAAGLRVLRYDVRGHGGSETPPGPYTIGQIADDARALLDAPGIRDVHFVGMSMGGLVAMAPAPAFPDPVPSLVPFDTTASY